MPVPFASVTQYKDFIRVSGSSLDAFYGTLLGYVTAAIQRYTGQKLTYNAAYQEILSPSGMDYVTVRQRPLISISALYFDPNALYGNAANAFGVGTLQVSGTDYAVEWDTYDAALTVPGQYSQCGIIRLLVGQGSGRGYRTGNRLTHLTGSAYGTIKLVGAVGFPDAIFPSDLVLATLMLTRALELTGRNAGWATSSEGTKYYNYSLSDVLNKELQVRSLLAPYKGMGIIAR